MRVAPARQTLQLAAVVVELIPLLPILQEVAEVVAPLHQAAAVVEVPHHQEVAPRQIAENSFPCLHASPNKS